MLPAECVKIGLNRRPLALPKNPTPVTCKQLAGEDPPLYRLRVDDYRILYQAEDDVLLFLIVHVGHRKNVYRFLKK
ncbi:MAG: type II toxin-antitoxin system RelE/ParE family toxin [Desulfuromonadaceae bacterium]|nr:type II toxin-antitoxin system RelE/ParE family toxin [Desulfuromonadaceae bacterium]